MWAVPESATAALRCVQNQPASQPASTITRSPTTVSKMGSKHAILTEEAPAAKRVRLEENASEFTKLLRTGLGNNAGILKKHDHETCKELLPLLTQVEAVKQLLAPVTKRFMLAAHAPGGGKTVLGALAYAALRVLHGKGTTAIIAVPTNIIKQWGVVLRRWLVFEEGELLIVHTSGDLSESALEKARIVVLSHGIVTTVYSNGGGSARNRIHHQLIPCADWATPLFKKAWTLLVVDEAHLARNTTTILCAALERLGAASRYRLALTGTPVINSASDYAGLATQLAAPQAFRVASFWGKKTTVCEEALVAFAPHMHRVSENELGLPGLREHSIFYDLKFSPMQAKQYNASLLKLRSIAKRMASEQAEAQDASVALSVLSKLQQFPVSFVLGSKGASNWNSLVDAEAAVDENMQSHRALTDTLAKAFQTSNRACVFACHTSVLSVAEAVIRTRWNNKAANAANAANAATDANAANASADNEPVKIVYYRGGLSAKIREERLQSFKSSTGKAVMLLTIGAGGIGLDIGDAAKSVIFWGSCGFTPASREQAFRRLLRYGQTDNVDCYDIYAKHTVEDGIRSIHTVKSAVTEAAVNKNFVPLAEVSSDRLLRIVDCLMPISEITGNVIIDSDSDGEGDRCAIPDTPAKNSALATGADRVDACTVNIV